jgi:hypothetical protein
MKNPTLKLVLSQFIPIYITNPIYATMTSNISTHIIYKIKILYTFLTSAVPGEYQSQSSAIACQTNTQEEPFSPWVQRALGQEGNQWALWPHPGSPQHELEAYSPDVQLPVMSSAPELLQHHSEWKHCPP